MFTDEQLYNKAMTDQALTFDPLWPELAGDTPLKTGAFYQTNGDVLFRLYLPEAQSVHLRIGQRQMEIALQKDAHGIHEGTLPYVKSDSGPQVVNVMVGGTVTLYPWLPVFWTGNRPCNYVEIPDTDNAFAYLENVPHGAMVRAVYHTHVLGSWERCNIYTPPGYMNGNENYPVLYLLNGGTDNEMCWEYTGKVAYILDNLIAAGQCKPFIVVMNNGMLRYPDTRPGVVDDAFERMLVESCIPYIEQHYRVKTDKWSRAIGGLSMGSFMTCDIGFNHPELFGYMGHFTANMTEKTLKMSYERPFRRVMAEGPERFAEKYRVFYRSTTPNEDHFDYFEADDEICKAAGVAALPCYHRSVYSPETSKWNSWRMGLRDYAQLLF
jgi:enterochelin esterase family protein